MVWARRFTNNSLNSWAISRVAGSRWSMAVFLPLFVYTLKRLRFSKVVSMRPGERSGVLRKCLQAKGLRHLLKLLEPIPAVPPGFSQIHHEERLPSPVVDVKHSRFGFPGYHHDQRGALLFVMVPEEPESGMFYIYDRARQPFFMGDLADVGRQRRSARR